MSLETQIELRCPRGARSLSVARDEYDYPEAVRVEVVCDKCDDGDFAEVMHYDADGNHITRDPSQPAPTNGGARDG